MHLLVRCSYRGLKQALPPTSQSWRVQATLRSTTVGLQPFGRYAQSVQLQHFHLRQFSTGKDIQDGQVSTPAKPPSTPKRSLLSRFLPSAGGDTTTTASSFRSIVSLAKPEKRPLGIAIGLLLVSSSVSMTIPLTVGKLIDYFTSPAPVSALVSVVNQ